MTTASPASARRPTSRFVSRATSAWAIGLLAMFTVVATASARPKPPRDGFPPLPHLIDRLSLTGDQITAEKGRHDAMREANKSIQQSMKSAHDALRTLWAAEKPNRAAIMAKVGEIDALRAKLAAARVDEHLAFIASLTDAQRAELRKLLAEPPPPHGGKRHGR